MVTPVLIIAAAAVALAGAPGQPRSAAGVLSAEKAWVAALEQRDPAGLERLLAADFIDTDWRGVTHSKADVLDGLPARPPRKIALSDLRVSLYGDFAIVRGRSVTGPASGPPSARVRFTDVFAYRDGRWRALSAQETLEAARKP